jgi:uncharacterized protein (TIGR02246 family)
MIRIMRRITLALILFATPALAQSAADEAAVREVIQKYTSARDLKDPRAIEALFTADADQHTTSGEWRRGRDRVVPGTLEASSRNPGNRSIKVEAVRFLSPDVAIADGPYLIEGTNRPTWTTIVTMRDGGTWRIAAIRNMVPTGALAPPAR